MGLPEINLPTYLPPWHTLINQWSLKPQISQFPTPLSKALNCNVPSVYYSYIVMWPQIVTNSSRDFAYDSIMGPGQCQKHFLHNLCITIFQMFLEPDTIKYII